MKHDKKCSNCSRFYRGDGYKDVCTYSCYVDGQYAKKLKKPMPQYIPYKKHVPKESCIEKANKKWVLDEKPKPKTREQKARTELILSTKHVRHDEWSGRQYRSVRG